MPGREVTQLVQLMARMVEEGTSVHTFVEVDGFGLGTLGQQFTGNLFVVKWWMALVWATWVSNSQETCCQVVDGFGLGSLGQQFTGNLFVVQWWMALVWVPWVSNSQETCCQVVDGFDLGNLGQQFTGNLLSSGGWL